jgi:hypothetical protein
MSYKHKYSIETLWHFNCSCCGKWWSIGDYQLCEKSKITCPHCGTEAEYEETLEIAAGPIMNGLF